MPIDDEIRSVFADRGSLVATSSKDGPPPYSSKVLIADPARGPWRSVYASDALYRSPSLANGFLALLEYREQGGGAYTEKVVVVDLPSGRAQAVDTYALSPATYRGGGGGPPRPSGAALMGGGFVAWVRLIEKTGGTVSGELRVGFPHRPGDAKVVAASETWIRPVSLDTSIDGTTLVYSIAQGSSAELRTRNMGSGVERVLATGRLSENSGALPFDPVARSGTWVAWVEETPPTGSTTFATSTLRAVNVQTNATRELPLGQSSCRQLTGNDRSFALNCSGPGTAPPHMVLLETASWTQLPVARSTGDGPFFLEAVEMGELLWQDRVNGARRVVLFTPTTDPAVVAATTPLVTRENVVLGYRIGLPDRYRLALSVIEADSSGQDFYTPRSEEADRELCQREIGSHVASPERITDLRIAVQRSSGMSAIEFVSAPARHAIFTAIEEVTIDGHDAARVVQLPSGDTAYYVIRANDRLYEIAPFVFAQPTDPALVGWIDQIALSFRALPPQSPSGTPSPVRTLCGAT